MFLHCFFAISSAKFYSIKDLKSDDLRAMLATYKST